MVMADSGETVFLCVRLTLRVSRVVPKDRTHCYLDYLARFISRKGNVSEAKTAPRNKLGTAAYRSNKKRLK